MAGTWWFVVAAAAVEERILEAYTVMEQARGWDRGSAVSHENDGRRGIGLWSSIAGWMLVEVEVRRRRMLGRGRPWDCSLLIEGRRRLAGRAVDSGHRGRRSRSGTCNGCMVLGSGRQAHWWEVEAVVEAEFVLAWGVPLLMNSEEM